MRHTIYPVEERFQSNGLLLRLSTTRSIRQPVMCGVLGVSCMRYGVSDTNLSRDTQMFRYTPSFRRECALSCLDLFQAIKMVDGGQRVAPPPGCPRAIYKLMINCWSVTPQTTHSIICIIYMYNISKQEPSHLREAFIRLSLPESRQARPNPLEVGGVRQASRCRRGPRAGSTS